MRAGMCFAARRDDEETETVSLCGPSLTLTNSERIVVECHEDTMPLIIYYLPPH